MIVDYVKFRDNALLMAEGGYVPIFGEFLEPLGEVVNECIWKIKRASKKDAILLIDSNGGDNAVFSSIRATMVESGLIFRGLVLGKAYSNGFNILQACHKREILSGANVLFHWGSQQIGNNMLNALINGKKWVPEYIVEKELVVLRFVSKRTGISEKVLMELAAEERMIPAKFALELGMVDEIIDTIPVEVSTALKEVRTDIPAGKVKKEKKGKKTK